ncbi:DUF3370 domain-containing protein [Synechococcus sp. MIT S9504]|uniref:DUF3370 domain-containing protein n=1 Tax=Synechococcus sp. MIT S9504 TaxID=1801628 RepID=UPI0007BB8104|nr:DUF3370 domain-containing protein [Synechococcus sp. MIT S9504]KZR85156.1 hypothetical protein MITS9504_02360 [Synechococcus sp. MIT S9504]
MTRLNSLQALAALTVATASIATVFAPPQLAADQQKPADQTLTRRSDVRALPGQLDDVLMVNDNNPELITGEGILVSTFPQAPGLNIALNGRFDLFSHHVYAGQPDQLDSTLWLAVVAQPAGDAPVTLRLLGGSTSLSQATVKGQTASPFLPLPTLMAESGTAVASGPGSKVAGDLLRGDIANELQQEWLIAPGNVSPLVVLPIPVAGLDPLLNGRNLQLRLQSSGPVHIATLAAYGNGDKVPDPERWIRLLNQGRQSPKEHQPTPRGARGRMVYSRVSGVQIGSTWRATLTDPGSSHLNIEDAPVSWPISSLERGELQTGQIQTAELKAFDAGTAWAAHGNYGVEYDLTLPLRNQGSQQRTLAITLDSPDKNSSGNGQLVFNGSDSGPVMFRGPIEVSGLDAQGGRPSGRRRFHLVLRRGQEGPQLGQITLAPGETRSVRVRLVYPADATPPQVLSLRPVKQSTEAPVDRP